MKDKEKKLLASAMWKFEKVFSAKWNLTDRDTVKAMRNLSKVKLTLMRRYSIEEVRGEVAKVYRAIGEWQEQRVEDMDNAVNRVEKRRLQKIGASKSEKRQETRRVSKKIRQRTRRYCNSFCHSRST